MGAGVGGGEATGADVGVSVGARVERGVGERVAMEVEMTYFNGQLVPKTLRYKGNWDIVFQKREIGLFTATLFDFTKGQ